MSDRAEKYRFARLQAREIRFLVLHAWRASTLSPARTVTSKINFFLSLRRPYERRKQGKVYCRIQCNAPTFNLLMEVALKVAIWNNLKFTVFVSYVYVPRRASINKEIKVYSKLDLNSVVLSLSFFFSLFKFLAKWKSAKLHLQLYNRIG